MRHSKPATGFRWRCNPKYVLASNDRLGDQPGRSNSLASLNEHPRQGERATAAYGCIKAFSETDFTEDLKKIDVPTLIIHGDDDQIVPIADSALRSAKLVKNAALKVIPDAPHGMCSTQKQQINEELLAFFSAGAKSAAA